MFETKAILNVLIILQNLCKYYIVLKMKEGKKIEDINIKLPFMDGSSSEIQDRNNRKSY